MDIKSVSFNGWYKFTNRQLSGMTPKESYLFGVSTAQFQRKNDSIEGRDGLYIKVNDTKKNEFINVCKKFNIIPERINI